jgi:TatD DNase family protein
MWIDSHCHLNHPKIEEVGTPADIIARAKEAGVEGMLTICCRIREDLNDLLDITKANDNIWCSIGTHPHDSGIEQEKDILADEMIELANNYDKIIGVGEAGLDYYYDNSPREDQQAGFRKHIHVAKETGLPLIIHTRDAEEDTIRILREEGACDGKTRVLMHCFSSNATLAKQSIDEGFYMSFSGMVTFKKATELQEIAKSVPLDRLLVETDAPYLAPVPYRGKTNEPAFVVHTGRFMADLFNLREQEMAQHTKDNFFRLFDKAAKTYVADDVVA